jgi:hypothetical protein
MKNSLKELKKCLTEAAKDFVGRRSPLPHLGHPGDAHDNEELAQNSYLFVEATASPVNETSVGKRNERRNFDVLCTYMYIVRIFSSSSHTCCP